MMKMYHAIEELEGRRHYAATPNDTSYSKQADLTEINLSKAWNYTTGSTNVVVADIDTGLTYDHPDLYENVWINQGEIPGNVRKHLKDVDKDGRITFYDLNSSKNRRWVTDVNKDGRIDAGDLLTSTAQGGWDDGVDADKNGYADDIIGWDFAQGDNDPLDGVGHGTHTAGTMIAEQNNGTGIAGIAKASLMVVKIFQDDGDGATEDQIAAAIKYSADMGAKLSNNSWGYTISSYGNYALTYNVENSARPTYYYPPRGGYGGYYPGSGDDTGGSEGDAIEDAITYAGKKGQLFVAAAGNDTVDNDFSYLGSYPASYDLDNIVSVAAADAKGDLSYFSNYGTDTVDIAAPGEDVYSTWIKDGYQTESGTSMATPHVTATLALMLAKYPKLTAAELKADLLASVNTNADLYSALVSGGLLNAGGAVRLAAVQRSHGDGDYGITTSSVRVQTAVFSTSKIKTYDTIADSVLA